MNMYTKMYSAPGFTFFGTRQIVIRKAVLDCIIVRICHSPDRHFGDSTIQSRLCTSSEHYSKSVQGCVSVWPPGACH